MLNRIVGIGCLLALVGLVGACSSTSTGAPPASAASTATPTKTAPTTTSAAKPTPKSYGKVTFREDFTTPSASRAPFWVGMDKGFYKDEGIDLEILPGQTVAVSINLLATKKDTFLFQTGSTMIKAWSRDNR